MATPLDLTTMSFHCFCHYFHLWILRKVLGFQTCHPGTNQTDHAFEWEKIEFWVKYPFEASVAVTFPIGQTCDYNRILIYIYLNINQLIWVQKHWKKQVALRLQDSILNYSVAIIIISECSTVSHVYFLSCSRNYVQFASSIPAWQIVLAAGVPLNRTTCVRQRAPRSPTDPSRRNEKVCTALLL